MPRSRRKIKRYVKSSFPRCAEGTHRNRYTGECLLKLRRSSSCSTSHTPSLS